MTPDFALSLSVEGIKLLHRGAEGWNLVGEVALDREDLGAAMADLRRKGEALAGAPIRTKLLIPDDQIRYLSIDRTQTDLDDIHAALAGATPYRVDELQIDHDRSGGRTHIAAVARETLAEAEAFATEHGMGPVAFAAIPPPFTFRGEVFFGPARAADGLVAPDNPPERDDVPVVVTGVAALEGDAPVPVEAAQPETVMPPAPEPRAEAPVFASRHRGESTAMEVSAPPAPEPEPDEPTPVFTRRRPEADAPAEPLFTRRAPEPDLSPAPPSAEPEPEPVAEPEPEPVADTVAAGFASIRQSAENAVPPPPEPPRRAPQDAAAAEPRVAPLPPPRKPLLASTAMTDLPDTPAPPVVAAPVAAKPEAPRAPKKPAPPAPEPEAERMTVFGARRKGEVGGKPRFLGLMMTAGLLIFLLLVALWAGTLTEEGIAGWFKRDDLVPVQTPEVEIAAAPVTEAPEAGQKAPSALAPEETVAIAPEPAPTPVVRAPVGGVLSPAEADRIYAATGVYQRAPRISTQPRETTLEGFIDYDPLPEADVAAQPDPLAMTSVSADLPLTAPPAPPPAGTVFQRDLRGNILATPAGVVTPSGAFVIAGPPEREPPARPGTEAAPAPSVVAAAPAPAAGEGLILIAGRPPLVPPLRPEGIAPADEAAARPLPASPVEDADATALALAAVTAGVADALEEAEATASAPALAVVAGPPERTPPPRPAGFVAPEAEAVPDASPAVVVNPAATVTPGGVSLASFKPSTRPASLVPAEPYADPALAGFRAPARPAGLAPETEEETAPEDINAVFAAISASAPASAFNNVTAQAIRRSPRPDTRPRNFNQVVARAQATQQRQVVAAASTADTSNTATRAATSVSSAAVAPTGPVPGSVAQAATVSNAINLRDMSLIGVYGRPNARRALIRMGNGRYVKVEVGSSLDGGRVTAIGDSALNFVKRGRTYALQLPNS